MPMVITTTTTIIIQLYLTPMETSLKTPPLLVIRTRDLFVLNPFHPQEQVRTYTYQEMPENPIWVSTYLIRHQFKGSLKIVAIVHYNCWLYYYYFNTIFPLSLPNSSNFSFFESKIRWQPRGQINAKISVASKPKTSF